jgi:hypothetical protein
VRVEIGPAALPLATAVVAGALAARVGGSAVRRLSAAKVLWALGLLLFAIGAAAEAYGTGDGWGSASFRAYYLAGGCLTVAFLGAGSAWRALPRDVALVVTGALAAASAGAAVSVLVADVDPARIAAATGLRPPANAALLGHAFVWAIVLNAVGSLLLLGSSGLAVLRRRAARANVAIIAGVLAAAGSGGLTRLGSYGFVYAGQIVGLVLLAAGFELAERAPGRPRARPRGLGVAPAGRGSSAA